MPQFITFSKGISKAKELECLISGSVFHVSVFQQLTKKYKASGFTNLGWGRKNNTSKARAFSRKNDIPFWSLEDGFISYLGHPALGDRRFSLIVDTSGIYYDATQPSDIEDLLNHPEQWLTAELQARSVNLLETICRHQITKYNHEPITDWKPDSNDQKRVLVVDQTYGDCSVKYGMADDASFKNMLQSALTENPDAEIWVKIHPDVVLGKKKGYFELEPCGRKIKGFRDERLKVLADKVNAQSLFPHFGKVYVVTSQLGFEALWHKKEVVCFGVPFYSNWGLTDDRVECARRTQKHSIEGLFAAACLKYTRYIDPETHQRCDLEDIIELIVLQRHYQRHEVNTLYLVGFSLWKKAFMKQFLVGMASSCRFVKSLNCATKLAEKGDGLLIWGAKEYGYKPPEGVALYRCEDAFIRGKGLGAELKRPQSLIVDRSGMYFDCSKPSDLERAINAVSLSEHQIERAKKLKEQLVKQRISKYNLSGKYHSLFNQSKPAQTKILVAGQVDSDASIQFGSPNIRSNLALLKQVRQYAPEAYIVYKPHPDVVMAGRKGHIPEHGVLKWADELTTDCDIFDAIAQCDEFHVMTSLAGFEALLQNKTVHTWGLPFYSNWGLTSDHVTCERRQANRTLDELVYFAHCYYPRYINWNTGRFSTPERVIQSLNDQKQTTLEPGNPVSNWLGRTKRKIGYLYEALSNSF